MSDDDYISPAEVRPGMHVEIVQRPWRGVITAPLDQGSFRANRDDVPGADWVATSWSVDNIGSIRLLPDPLPTTPGERFWGRSADGHQGMAWSALPSWWFIMKSEDGRVWYQRADASDPWKPEDVERWGLVRLPDPDVTP